MGKKKNNQNTKKNQKRLQFKGYLKEDVNSDRKMDTQGPFVVYAPAVASGLPKAVQLTLTLPLHLVLFMALQTGQSRIQFYPQSLWRKFVS